MAGKKYISFYLLIFCLFGSSCAVLAPSSNERPLQITFLPAGDGSAVLITCPDTHVRTLIDAGASMSEDFIPQLRAAMENEKTIARAISTSARSERIGGFVDLLRSGEFSIQEFVDSGLENPTSDLDETVRRLLAEKGIKRIDFSEGRIATLEICPGSSSKRANMLFFPLSTSDALLLSCAQRSGECSLMSRLEYKGNSALFGADIGAGREERILADPALRARLRADIFQVPHAGLANPNGPAFLEAVNPAYAILGSNGEDAEDSSQTKELSQFFNRKYSESRILHIRPRESRTFLFHEGKLIPPPQ